MYSEELWKPLLGKVTLCICCICGYGARIDTKLGDPDPSEFAPSPDFVFVICCSAVESIPAFISQTMHVFKVEDPPLNDNSNLSPEDAALNEVCRGCILYWMS